MLTGRPPFVEASKTDKWFKPLFEGKRDEFWRMHQWSPIAKNHAVQDLLTRMLCADPTQRIDINGIKNHEWFWGKTLTQKKLISVVGNLHSAAQKKRRKDARKLKNLARSVNPNKSKNRVWIGRVHNLL